MSLALNGTTSKLVAATSGWASAYPVAIFCWMKTSSVAAGGAFPVGVGDNGGDSELAIQRGAAKALAFSREPGQSSGPSSTEDLVVGNWVPCLAVFHAINNRDIYLGNGAKVNGTVSITPTLSAFDRIVLGTRPKNETEGWFAGELAHVAIWRGGTALNQADFDALKAGAIPDTIKNASLVDYWSLSTQAATQTGVKGTILTATATTQGSTDPLVSDTTAPVLTSPTGTSTGSTTASGTVSTDEANGTLYRYASVNASETAATIKAAALTQAVSATGAQNVSFTGLAPSTVYYAHYVHRDAAGNDSAAVSSASFTTAAAGDTTPPVLTSPTGTKTGPTTASGSVSTDEANGTLYRYASTNASESAATVKAAALTQAVSATGVQNVTFTGLNPSTSYYAHYVHRDAAGNDSTVASSAAFVTDPPADSTPPTLTSPTGTATGQTTATGSVSTNEGNGTLYRYVSTNASETAATVKAANLTTAVSGTGVQNVSFTGLAAGTLYYAHYVHRDAAGNDSTVATSASFTTNSVIGTIPVLPMTRNTAAGGLWRGVSGITILVHSLAGALVATKSGLATDDNGLLTAALTDAAFAPGTSYRCTIVMPSGDIGIFQATATA